MDQKEITVVAAVIKDSKDRVLITQRGEGMKFCGKWEFPGGKVDDGEDFRDALKREILEELRLVIEVGGELLTWRYSYPFAHVHFVAFEAKVKSGKLKLMEHMASEWAPINKLETYDWVPADIELVSVLSQ